MDGNSLDYHRCNLYRFRLMKTFVVSLGGSLIAPDKIDVSFLKRFRKLILNYSKKYRFVIYCGGGSLARNYQKYLKNIIGDKKNVLDWMGIAATYLNASLVRLNFGDSAEQAIIQDPTKKIRTKKRILIAAGWKPGWSTDYDAVLLAKNLGADMVINMTNVDYVYDKDPKYKDAKPIKQISFKEIKRIIGAKWSPGLNAPFDPVAVNQAEKLKLKIIIIGKSINNLRAVLENKKFKGTIIAKNTNN